MIDDVLEPVLIKSSASSDMQTTYPDAHQFLTYSENMEIGDFRLRTFRSRVDMQKRQPLFQAPGQHTFFIPVEEGFKSIHRPDLIDRRVIDGHVIPDRAVFTAAAPLDEPLNTAAFGENLKVQITFFSQGEGHHKRSGWIVVVKICQMIVDLLLRLPQPMSSHKPLGPMECTRRESCWERS